jgi:hypothetical protein
MIMALGSLFAAGVLTMLVVKSDAATEAESGETRPEAPASAIAHGR